MAQPSQKILIASFQLHMNLIFNVLFAGRGIFRSAEADKHGCRGNSRGQIVIYCRCKRLYSAHIRRLGAVILTVVSLCRMYEVLGQCMNTKKDSCFKQELPLTHFSIFL